MALQYPSRLPNHVAVGVGLVAYSASHPAARKVRRRIRTPEEPMPEQPPSIPLTLPSGRVVPVEVLDVSVAAGQEVTATLRCDDPELVRALTHRALNGLSIDLDPVAAAGSWSAASVPRSDPVAAG